MQNKQKKKMAIICSTDYVSYPMGGMMSFILDILPKFSEKYEIDLWGVDAGNSENKITISNSDYNVNFFSKVKTGKKWIPNLLRVAKDIYLHKNEILKNGYDVIYIHGIPLSFPFFNLKNTLVINHIHGMTNPFLMTPNILARNIISCSLYEKYRKWVIKRSDLIFLASDVVGHKTFSSRFPESYSKIKYIPNFADRNVFHHIDKLTARSQLNLSADKLIFVNTGRISLQKDPVLLIKAFYQFKLKYKDPASLVIIGDGELKEKIISMCDDLGLNDDVIVTGKLSRDVINLWLNASDTYLYTSHANGFPISLAEASICGLPIVTTDVNGVHDLVVSDVSGMLVDSRDPIKFSNAITSIIPDVDRLGKNALDISKMFSSEITISKMLNYMTDRNE